MAAMKADRRLAFNAGRTRMLEETDPQAAYLAYPAGGTISDGDVKAFGLSAKDGLVVLPAEGKMVPAGKTKDMPEARDVFPVGEPEPAEPSGEFVMREDLEEDEDADEDAPEWTLSSTPEEYLERYGEDAKNSALARAVIEAAEG